MKIFRAYCRRSPQHFFWILAHFDSYDATVEKRHAALETGGTDKFSLKSPFLVEVSQSKFNSITSADFSILHRCYGLEF